jgi:hypothetical protein
MTTKEQATAKASATKKEQATAKASAREQQRQQSETKRATAKAVQLDQAVAS